MVLAVVIDLNKTAHYVHAGFFQMSVPNLVAIIVMLVVFGVAIAAPFPGNRRRRSTR